MSISKKINFTIKVELIDELYPNIVDLYRSLILFKSSRYTIEGYKGSKLKKADFFSCIEQLSDFKKYNAYLIESSSDTMDCLWLRYYHSTNIIEIFGNICISDLFSFDIIKTIIDGYSARNSVLCISIRTFDEYRYNDTTYIDMVKLIHPEMTSIKTVGQKPHIDADPEQFPAHTHNIDGIWFGCCYEMWFGRDYDKYIPLEKLRSFDQCKLNETLENGTVHIVLYDSPDDFASEKSVANAWAFRKHTECDKEADFWEAQVRELSKGLGQQVYEIEEGKFPHGGIRLIKTYLDENGKHVTKKDASKVHISERGHDGKAVFEKIDDL